MVKWRDRHGGRERVMWRVLKVIGRSPELMIPGVFRNLACFLGNLGAVFEFASREGISLEYGRPGTMPGETLQFYFDLSRDGQDLGFLSRGWDDPGIRMGDLLRVRGGRKAISPVDLRAVLEPGASNGVAFQIHEHTDGTLELELWVPVYGDVTRAEDLSQALKSLEKCKQRLGRIIPLGKGAP